MPHMSVELTEDDIKEAVVDWALKHRHGKIAPASVHVRTAPVCVGYGMAERTEHQPQIGFRT